MTVAHVAVNVATGRAKGSTGVLGPLGIASSTRSGALAYFADASGSTSGSVARPVGGAHVASTARSRAVDSFYERRSRGRKGQRPARDPPQYDENYYAAYVLDPDGNNIEAVCHHAPT